MTPQQILDIGFVKYAGTDGFQKNRELFIIPTDNLGWNIGIDLLNNEFFSFEGYRSTAYPYPIPARIIQNFKFPENVEQINSVFESITGRALNIKK